MVTTVGAEPNQKVPSLISATATSVWVSASLTRVATLARPARGPSFIARMIGSGLRSLKIRIART